MAQPTISSPGAGATVTRPFQASGGCGAAINSATCGGVAGSISFAGPPNWQASFGMGVPVGTQTLAVSDNQGQQASESITVR